MDTQKLWQTVLGELEVVLSRANFTTWFKNTFIAEYNEEENKIVIAVPNNFVKEWLEKKYHKEILNCLKKSVIGLKEVIYRVQTKPILNSEINIPFYLNSSPENKTTNLNKKYTFDNFIVGSSNQLAFAASQSVVKNPGENYNPLFIYGGVGLGKTHLLQAIGNEILKTRPKYKVLYITSEKFTNEIIQAITTKKTNEFRNKYRKIDCLLIDDIQFLAKKETTQEEFFNTFNSLYNENKQIVLTSDRPPKAIVDLEKRLSSRFESGMIADITPPDFEMRVAILKQKSREKNYEINDDVINYIAENIKRNIRELEGALIRLIAYHELQNVPINLENAKQILSELFTSRARNLDAQKLIETVSSFYELSSKDILGPKRDEELARCRQIIMYLLRTELNFSFPKIGKILGNRDHTTIMHGYRKIDQELKRNEPFKYEINLIKEKLYNE